MKSLSRRNILGACGAGLWLGKADAEVTPEIARFRPEMEPLVRLIEETQREKIAERVVDHMRRGVSYRQWMGALFLAGVRNVNPRPPGFALHCVFVIHSAHLLGMEAPGDVRMLPLFYALDLFKASQERDSRQGDYVMRELSGPLPSPDKAAAELDAAMEAWDPERAERAAAALARQGGATDAFDHLWRYGARDYRNIGHKAIFTANAYRTLETIGWQHAEPVLRSLVLGLLDFGKTQEVNGYRFEDQTYLANMQSQAKIFAKLPAHWSGEAASPDVARGMVETIRAATPAEACADAADRLMKGKATAGDIWDAVHLAGAELAMRTRNITGIHAVTAANGLHHSYLAARDPKVRHLLLLQGIGWMGQFRTFADSRDPKPRMVKITALEPEKAALGEIPEGAIGGDPAAAGVIGAGRDDRQTFLSAAMRHTIVKANEVHYYKYLAALAEDIPLMHPQWQPHLAAAAVYYMKTAKDAEPEPMKRARAALGAG